MLFQCHKPNLIYIFSCNLNSYRLHLRLLTLFTLFLICLNGKLLGRIITYNPVNKVNKVGL